MSSKNDSANEEDDADEMRVNNNTTAANPFSFKSFLAKSTGTDSSSTSTNHFSFNSFEQRKHSLGEEHDIPLETLPEIEPSDLIPPPSPSSSPPFNTNNFKESDVNSKVDDSVISSLLPDEMATLLDEEEDTTTATSSQHLVISMQQAKIVKLERRLKELLEKEENENSALEKVVQQVEKKLLKATNRALESEKTVEILRQENKELRGQLKTLTAENVTLRQAQVSHMLKENKSRLGEISDELSSVASAAEQSLNQLLAGVNNLRLVASNLNSLEKIVELEN